MVTDTIADCPKQLRPSDDVVESLMNLRDEMWARQDPEHLEVFCKINSCLYRGYPNKAETEVEELLRRT